MASKMLGKELDAITKVDRQTGKIGDLSAGFGGSVGAWRRQIVDERSDFADQGRYREVAAGASADREVLARPRALYSDRDQDRAIGLCRHAAGSDHHGPFRSRQSVPHAAVGTRDHLSRSAPGALEVRGLSARRGVQGQRSPAMEGRARLARNLHRERGAGDRARHSGGGDRAHGSPRPPV